MSVNLHRVLDELDGEFAGTRGSVDVSVAADVVPGDTIRVRLEADGPGAKSRTITADLSASDARLLGGRLLAATE